MKLPPQILLVIVSLVTLSPDSSVVAEDELVVMTWNLEWFFDDEQYDNRSDLAREMSAPDRSSWNWRRDAVADAIASINPSLLAVQEAESSKILRYLCLSLQRKHQLKYRVQCLDGAEPFTEQDVGMLHNGSLWPRRVGHNGQTKAMYSTKQYYNVFKHIETTYEIGRPSDPEIITVINVHLRARAEKSDIRVRQARLVHSWIAERASRGENIIVLGDINTEEPGTTSDPSTDLGILCGLHTESTDDDMVDLHSRLPAASHRTHLLENKAFDRIFVSQALIADSPGRADLVLKSVTRHKELSVKGAGIDDPEKHWDAYWQMDESQRDLSDHWPVVATFELK